MTIEKCIVMLSAKEKCMNRATSGIDMECNSCQCDNCYLNYEQGNIGQQKDSLILAIDIMRKYRQIIQIFKQWNEDIDFKSNQAMIKIGEVLTNDNKS